MTAGNSLIGAPALRRLALLAAAALLLAVAPLAGVAGADDVETSDAEDPQPSTIQVSDGDGLVPSLRFAGTGREDTARLISGDETDFAAEFETGTVVLARGDDYPDALAGSYIGGQEAGPILLTGTDFVPTQLEEALDHWGDPSGVEIVILGGTAAVSAEVEEELADMGYSIDRRGGATRVHTAAEVALAYDPADVGELDGMATAIVASAENFPDALVAGAISAASHFPLLLSWQDELPDVTADAIEDLGIEQILLAGGTAAVSQAVQDDLEDLVGSDNVRRVSGPNRFATAVAFSELAIDELGFTDNHVNLATGRNFPDALAMGPHAGLDYAGPAPILLTDLSMPPETGSHLETLADCSFESLHVAGGTAAISDAVEQEARETLTTDDDCPTLGAALLGANELDPDTMAPGAGDPDGGGTARVVADATANEVCVELNVTGIEPATAAHIHAGDATVNGPIVITLPTPDADGMASGCAMPDDEDDTDLVADILANPDDYYVNVHNEDFPGGAVRGQLDGAVLAAELSSENESDADTAALDPPVTGSALLVVNGDDGQICWLIEVNETAHDIGSFEAFGAVNAHIHVGAAGVDGAVLVPLGQVSDDTQTDLGCEAAADPGDLADVEADLEGHYVNVHTDDHPGGVVRGQLG